MDDARAVVFTDRRDVEVEERERPEPSEEEVLIETERTLISTGTELTMLSGEFPEGSVWSGITDYPFVPGYCNVGEVVETGDAVGGHLDGKRVVTWEGHSSHVTARLDDCVVVPTGVDAEEAAFTPIAQIVLNGLRRGELAFGEAVAVYGLGLLGQFATRFAYVAGARPVAGVDLAEERIGYLPPDVEGVDPTDTDPVQHLDRETDGRMADVVFEVTGSPDAIPDQFDALREGGRLVVLSSPRGETTLDLHDICNAPSTRIIGAHQTSHPTTPTVDDPWTKRRHAELFFEYLRDGDVDVGPLVSHSEPVERAPELYGRLLEDRTGAMGVQLEW